MEIVEGESQEIVVVTQEPVISPSLNTSSQDATSIVKEKRKRGLTSSVWTHYQRIENSDGTITAQCLYCPHKTDAASSKGTSHLATHTKNCKRRPKEDIKQTFLRGTTGSSNSTLAFDKFDPQVERDLFSMMVMSHDYPFLMSEHKYFRKWISYVLPTYKFRSRHTVRSDCLKVFNEEKSKLYKIIENVSSRVSITTDLWTPDHQDLGYCCMSCHFIDDDWKLNKKILAFNYVECPHTGEVLAEWMKQKILEWNIDSKLSSIVVDNASNNKPMVDLIKTWLNGKGSLLCNGELFHGRCCAHIINLIVKKGLEVISPMIEMIRNSVKYVGSSVQRNQKFKLVLSQCRLNTGKKVNLDVETRWNSTYLMLHSALELRSAFTRLAELDGEYKLFPTMEQWEKGSKVCECLKVFYNITLRLSGTKYPTSNYYFKEVCSIHYYLSIWQKGDEDCIRTMALLMQDKFDKYWGSNKLVLTIGFVLDPRYKMKFVNTIYKKIYGDASPSHTVAVEIMLKDLFSSYMVDDAVVAHPPSIKQVTTNINIEDPFLADFIEECEGDECLNSVETSELDEYLKEKLEPLQKEDPFSFDILNWWNNKGRKYPKLRRMARDILAIPVSTVASESAFSWGRRIIEDTRSNLSFEVVEALLCTKDWLSSNDMQAKDQEQKNEEN